MRSASPLGCSALVACLALQATGCTALISTDHFHPGLVEGPADVLAGSAARPVWSAGGRLELSGRSAALRLEGRVTGLQVSSAELGGRVWSIGPLLPLLPVFASLAGDVGPSVTVNLFVERAAQPVRFVLEDLTLRPRAANVPLRPLRYTTTRWPEHETRPLAEDGRTEVLLGEGEMIWLTYDAPTQGLEAFDLRLAFEEADGATLAFAVTFDRVRSTYWAIAP